MNEDYARQLLRVVLGRVCQPLGVHGMQSRVCDTMTDVLRSYLLSLGRITATYCTHANRTEPNLSDLSQAFRNLGVNLSDLSEFMREVDSSPLEQMIPRFPVPRKSTHIYQGLVSYGEMSKKRSRAPSLSSEDEEYDHIPPYLPPFPSQVTDIEKVDDDSNGVSMEIGETAANSSLKRDGMTTPTPMDPLRGLPQLFRPRGFSSDFSEDGDANGSRRNSISDEAVVAMPVQASTPTLPIVNELSVAECALVGTNRKEEEEETGSSRKKGLESVSEGDQASGDAKETSEVAVSLKADNEPVHAASSGSGDGTKFKFPAMIPSTNPGILPGVHSETSMVEGKEKLETALEISSHDSTHQHSQVTLPEAPGATATTPAGKNTQQLILPVLKPPTHVGGRCHPLLPPPLRLMSPTSSSPLSSEHPNLSPIPHSPSGRSLPLSPVNRGGVPKLGNGGMPILSPFRGPIKPVFTIPGSHSVPPQSVVPVKCESSMSASSTQSTKDPSNPPPSSSLVVHMSVDDPTPFVESAPMKSLSSSSSSSSASSSPTGEISAPSSKAVPLELDLQSLTHKSHVSEYSGSGGGDFSEEGPPSGGGKKVIEMRSGDSQSCLSPPSSDDVKDGSISPLGREGISELSASQLSTRPCLSSTSSEVSLLSVHGDVLRERTLSSASEVLDDDEELDIPLEISSSEGEEKEVFGFEQDLLPDRLSLSPMHPQMLASTSGGGLSAGSDVILQETTTRDSKVGVASAEVVKKSLSLGRTNSPSEDNYVDGGDDDGVGVSKLMDTVQKMCSVSVTQDFYSPPSSSSIPSLPVPILSSAKSLSANIGVPPRLEDKKKLFSTSLSHGHRASLHGIRTPLPGSRVTVALPCSPLVVHVKRHMVPSLRAIGGKQEREEEEEDEEEEEEGEEFGGSHFKTKAEMKAELFPLTTTYAVGHRPHTPSSSPTPSPSASLYPIKPTQVAKIIPLKVSIKRHILRSSSLRAQQTTPTYISTSPSDTLMKPLASRVKKSYAPFGRGVATTPPGAAVHSQSIMASQHVASSLQVNPRKRELDVSELGLPASQSKKFRHEARVEPPAVAINSSSSSSNSEDEDNDGEGESGSNSLSITPSPLSSTPPPSSAAIHYPVCPRTPSSIDDDEEDSIAPLESTGSRSMGKMGMLKLTINKALLPPVTVKHLGGVAEKGPRRSKKMHKTQRIPPAEIPALTICSSNPVEVCGSHGQGLGMARGGVGVARGGGGMARGTGSGKRRSGATRS